MICNAAPAEPAAPAVFSAQSTYDKLIKDYPQIRLPNAASASGVRSITAMTYAQHGGVTLQLDLYLPAQAAATGAPAVVLVHGGGWRTGQRENKAPLALRLAERGYAAATISYRLSPVARYPAAIHDVKAALRWMRTNAARYAIDPQRIAVAGASAGGQIASLTGVTSGMDRFDPDARPGAVSSAAQAIVNIDGLSDFTSEAARLHEDDPAKNPSAAGAWFGGRYAEKTALWREASPLFYVRRSTPPILFIGSAQARFAVGREDMVAKLTEAGVTSKVVMLPDTPHGFWLFDPWLEPTVEAMASFLATAMPAPAPWVADLGNGRYQNPILHADYSDPDAIRVGDTYYMTSSSFSNVPGLPLLRSKDLVNWDLVGHALAQLVPAGAFATPQPGKGVWAPCLRFHDGKFWIFYPDPDHGIYVMSATRFEGPWSAPHLLLAGKGLIDPTPLWDDDGKAYLIHGWARSRAGFNNVLTLRSMAPDARSVLDDAGRIIIDANKLPGYSTLEGPKLYKAHGYYYVFAPAGGVEHGWQTVFRARRIEGPYEEKIVLAQGKTPVNGPHQGAWVSATDGSDWFVHFQDKRAYGRVVHLQPMVWRDGWPLMGTEGERGIGEPVATHAKPPGRSDGVRTPPTGDEFAAPALGLQWQWSANSAPGWHSLSARPGYLRLFAQPGSQLREVASVLTQKLPAPSFRVDTRIELGTARDGDRAGLIMLGMKYAWLGLRQKGGQTQLVYATCDGTPLTCEEKDQMVVDVPRPPVYLRMTVADGVARFAYSLDQVNYKDAGAPFTASMGRWVGAQMGLFSIGGNPQSFADVDYFRVGRL